MSSYRERDLHDYHRRNPRQRSRERRKDNRNYRESESRNRDRRPEGKNDNHMSKVAAAESGSTVMPSSSTVSTLRRENQNQQNLSSKQRTQRQQRPYLNNMDSDESDSDADDLRPRLNIQRQADQNLLKPSLKRIPQQNIISSAAQAAVSHGAKSSITAAGRNGSQSPIKRSENLNTTEKSYTTMTSSSSDNKNQQPGPGSNNDNTSDLPPPKLIITNSIRQKVEDQLQLPIYQSRIKEGIEQGLEKILKDRLKELDEEFKRRKDKAVMEVRTRLENEQQSKEGVDQIIANNLRIIQGSMATVGGER